MDGDLDKSLEVPPVIDRNAIQEIRVHVGQPFQLDVPVAGKPPSEITWDFEGKPLSTDDRVKINNVDYRTKFVVKRALQSDTGTFNITARNDSGMDTAPVSVIVLDRPGDPQGPLNISNVNKTGCTLDWRTPLDDGGAGITHYAVEKYDFNIDRWMPCGESRDTNLVITDLTPGHEYKFRVKAVNKYVESDPLEAQKSIVAKDPFDTADRPGTPDIVDWDKDFADLKWTPPTNDGGAVLEKYIIEKKTGTGDWEYATEVSADKLDAHVEHLIPGKSNQFRVKAVNKAGESAPSDPSRTLLAKVRRLPPKIDRAMLNEIRIKAGANIDFNVNVEGEPNPKCQWFINDTPLTTSDRTKVDSSTDNNTKLKTQIAERVDSGKYTLVAINEHGKDEADVNVVVLDVPGPPNGPLDVRDVTKDSATVKWYSPDEDIDSLITHYIVEKQEDNGRWVPCGETTDTTLRDNRLNEGRDYKFRVKAMNRQGESKPLQMEGSVTAKNPWDTSGKPQDVKVVVWDKDHMDLEWKPPISDGGASVDNYIIEKKDKFGDWTTCALVPGSQTKGTVEGLIPGETYQIRVIAQNKAGKGEPSDPMEPKVAKPRKFAQNSIDMVDLSESDEEQKKRRTNPKRSSQPTKFVCDPLVSSGEEEEEEDKNQEKEEVYEVEGILARLMYGRTFYYLTKFKNYNSLDDLRWSDRKYLAGSAHMTVAYDNILSLSDMDKYSRLSFFMCDKGNVSLKHDNDFAWGLGPDGINGTPIQIPMQNLADKVRKVDEKNPCQNAKFWPFSNLHSVEPSAKRKKWADLAPSSSKRFQTSKQVSMSPKAMCVEANIHHQIESNESVHSTTVGSPSVNNTESPNKPKSFDCDVNDSVSGPSADENQSPVTNCLKVVGVDFHAFHHEMETVVNLLSVISNALLLYLIQYHSTFGVKLYKYLLTMDAFLDFLLGIMAFICQPIAMTGDGYFIIASSGYFADKSRFFDSAILMIFFFVLHTNILWIPVQFVYRYRLLCKGSDGSTVGTALVISTIAVLYSMFAAFVIWYMFVTPVDFQLVGVHRVLDLNFWPRSPDATYPFMFGSFITHSRIISWLLLWTTTCLSSIFIVIWCEKSIVKHFQQFGHLMNKNTQKMHKEFHRALLAMAICPLITTTGPVLYFMTTISLQLNPGSFSALMMCGVTSITLCNPLTTIFFVKCYRRVVLRLVSCGCGRRVAIVSTTTESVPTVSQQAIAGTTLEEKVK